MRTHTEVFIVLGAVLLWACPLAYCDAPGDEDGRCQLGSFRTTYQEGIIPLMDSLRYEQLLGVTGAMWTETDFDDNNNGFFFIQTNWQHSVGGICRWSIQSCGYSVGEQDNWAFTQYIRKYAPDGTDYDVTVCVNVTHRISNCRERYGCNPEFEVYNYIVNSAQPQEVVHNTTRYSMMRRMRVIRAATLVDQMCFNMTPDDLGFYIALRDPDSCILVSRVIAYRHECAAQQVGLVFYPRTAAPVSGSVDVDTTCAPNAERTTSLRVSCHSDGLWDGTPVCVCKPGYWLHLDVNRNQVCSPCPLGTYRSASDPQEICLPCPPNTAVDQVAAPECKCLTGYFRNTEGMDDPCPQNQQLEGPGTPCTKPPTRPILPQASSITANSILMSWGRPVVLGGRDDLYYTVEYSDPGNVGQMVMASGPCLTSTSFTITDLQPATDYVVRVMAHNGVSDQNEEGALAQMNEISVTTANAPPSAPVNVEVLCPVIVWEEPQRPNGELEGYEIMFFNGNDPDGGVTKKLNNLKTYYVMKGEEMSYEFVKVRAINDAGIGPWSEPTPILCLSPPVIDIQEPEPIVIPEPSATCTESNVGDVYSVNCLTSEVPSGSSCILDEEEIDCNDLGLTVDLNSHANSQCRLEITINFGHISKCYVFIFIKSEPPPPVVVNCPPQPTCPPPPECPTQECLTPTPTACPTVTCPTCPMCETPSECPPVECPTPTPSECPPVECPTLPSPSPTPVTMPVAVSTNDIHVLGCGIVSWEPPADTGGEMPGYAIRFFDGETYFGSPYREIQRHFDDPGRRWARAERLPSDRTVYADIRAANSAGASPFSTKIVVANATLCPKDTASSQTGVTTEQACDSCCEDCPTCPPPVTCPTCSTCPPPVECPTCPTVTCPTCPAPVECPTCPAPVECATCPTCPPTEDCPTCPNVECPVCTEAPASTGEIRLPGTVRNVNAFNCSAIVWEPPEDDGGEIMEYRIRLYTGSDYRSTPTTQRRVLISYTTWAIPDWIPTIRPVYAMVKAKNRAGFSAEWSNVVTLTDSISCPCSN